MVEWLRLSRPHRAAHNGDVNWAPLSEVMLAGTHSEPGDPAGKQGSGAVGSGDGGEWNCLWPPRCSADYGKQVSVAARRW